MTKAQRQQVAELIVELGNIASFKDIDTAIYIVNRACSELGIDPNTIQTFAEYRDL